MLAAVASLAGCAAGPNYHAPKPDTPPRFAAQTASADTAGAEPAPGAASEQDLATWWRALNDAELDALVDRAVKSNLDVQIALMRLQQARTYEAAAVSSAAVTPARVTSRTAPMISRQRSNCARCRASGSRPTIQVRPKSEWKPA